MVLAMGLKSLRIKKIKKRQKLAIQFANFGYEDKYASQSVRTPKVGMNPSRWKCQTKYLEFQQRSSRSLFA